MQEGEEVMSERDKQLEEFEKADLGDCEKLFDKDGNPVWVSPAPSSVSQPASSMAKKKWAKMTPMERRMQAKKAANARWGRR
jgi:hypothetical protein